MSINTITPTFNNYPSTDELTQGRKSVINSSHGRCACQVRDRKDSLSIEALENQTDAEYLIELLSEH